MSEKDWNITTHYNGNSIFSSVISRVDWIIKGSTGGML
jgi:hypothetical protein